MTTSQSLKRRALLAAALMAGFYLLAIVVIAFLFWMPYEYYALTGRMQPRLALWAVVIGGGLLWSILPRPDHFEPPGPRLTAAEAPGLFAIVDGVARATEQERPAEVYVIGDVNAFVSHRGGLMGVGSRRIMGVGLPLLQCLSPHELQAVIAHEFGHYAAGDVALAPWIYKTRLAIGRTMIQLEKSVVRFVFIWYARQFMRITMGVSRHQEFQADATAAGVGGREHMGSALKKVAVLGHAWRVYVLGEVLPLIQAGYLPPVTEGFALFMKNAPLPPALESQTHTTGEHEGEFDSHPPIADRLAALSRLPAASPGADLDVTTPLLTDLERHARQFLAGRIGVERVKQCRRIDWQAVTDSVYVAQWRATAAEHEAVLGRLTFETVPAVRRELVAFGKSLRTKSQTSGDEKAYVQLATDVIAAAAGTTLLANGWTVESEPGRAIEVVRADGERLNPHLKLLQLAAGQLSADEWRASTRRLGINGLSLTSRAQSPDQATDQA